ncbi:microfibril-associated glycoprotein 4-like [Asterias amurensis]|uniref:microfibril-associated glycoprotein 4-like n=1 Tax=Asterias amurensis TaxID=7602 RepID=UPI003AB22E16
MEPLYLKTAAGLFFVLVVAVFESACVDGGVVVSPRHEEVTNYGADVVSGTSAETGTGECYRPQVIIQAPTCDSVDIRTDINTELKEVKQKLDEVLAFLSIQPTNYPSVVPQDTDVPSSVKPKCTTPNIDESLTTSNCSVGEVESGTYCTYHCAEGITMQGDPTVSCGANGNWNQVLPICRATLERDCGDAVDKGYTMSGIYLVQPTDDGEPFEVFCDMDTDYGGWTVFQRRQDGSVNFFRLFAEYQEGFGNLEGEFWLGNDKLNRLTSQTNYELRVDLEDFEGGSAYQVYRSFNIGDVDSNYRLSVSSSTGTAGDSLYSHNNMPFSTKDKDNDSRSTENCAFRSHGAWWYKSCQTSNLNGWYLGPDKTEQFKGVTWYSWKDSSYSMKKSEMKIRFLGL